MGLLSQERITLSTGVAVNATVPVGCQRVYIFNDGEDDIRFAINEVATAGSPGLVPPIEPLMFTLNNLVSLSFWGVTGDYVGVHYYSS
jgi:hypothetical protein